MDEIIRALYQAVEYWNAHRHPYVWKKRPQDQLPLMGGFSLGHEYYMSTIYRENQLVVESENKSLAKFKLAIAYGLDGQYKPAIQLLEEVKENYPDSVIVYNKLGWAYALAGNYRQAISYYNQALVIDPADLFSLFELGKYYLIIGDKPRAAKYFDRIRRYDRTGEYLERISKL